MKIFYACEICGHTSGDIKQIEKCENQGKRNKYSKDQLVLIKRKGDDGEIKGTITGMVFKIRNHEITYGIVLSSNDRLHVSEDEIVRVVSE